MSLDVHVSDAPRVLLEGAAPEDVVKVQGSLAPRDRDSKGICKLL